VRGDGEGAALGIPCFDREVYHGGMIDETAIRGRFEAMRSRLDERERRLFAAAEARSAGYGGAVCCGERQGRFRRGKSGAVCRIAK
jgi:hypothetical protein